MPSSIPQVGGQHWVNHHGAPAFPGSVCYCETFAEQALVSHCEFMHLQQGRAG